MLAQRRLREQALPEPERRQGAALQHLQHVRGGRGVLGCSAVVTTFLYGTLWILYIAYLTKEMPAGYAQSDTTFRAIPPDLEDAGRILGGGASACCATSPPRSPGAVSSPPGASSSSA